MQNKVKFPSSKLPALERNILKYRSIEMTLVLFEVEELRKFLVNTIMFNHKIAKNLKLFNGGFEEIFALQNPESPDKKNLKEKKKMEAIWKVIQRYKILTSDEVTELKKIIDYRNNIAHNIHKMLCDVTMEHFRFYPSTYGACT